MKSNSLFYIFFLLILFCSRTLYGQIPTITTPQPAYMPTVPNYATPSSNYPSIPSVSNTPSQNPNRQLDMYEQDRRSIQRRDAAMNEMLNQHAASKFGIQYDLPSLADKQGAENYRKAARILNNMLNGTIPLNLKDAVFSVENAYFKRKLEYPKYNKAIQNIIATARLKAKQDGYNWDNPTTRNIMLFRVMSDTLKIRVPSKEGSITSFPMRYNYDDYSGEKDWSSMFVSKLLATKTGQCHSMPLLYLIMCEATNTDASLAFSPRHSYAKFKDQTGNWYNIELTNGYIVSDAFIMGSGFVSAEALKNKIYMEPQTKKQAIAECLGDLASDYIHDYGYDSFVSQCNDSTLKYAPNSLRSMSIKAQYQTKQFEYAVNQVGRPHPDSLKVHYPKVYKLLEERNKSYRWLDESGYREMPEEAYQKWLNFMDREKKIQEHQSKMQFLIQTTR